jgi:HEAT repeat protein
MVAPAWFVMRFARVLAYARALRGYCRRELARAGITSAHGLFSLQSTGVGVKSAHSRNAARRLGDLPRALLIGEEGAGKSVTLLAIALRESDVIGVIRAALGLARLPTLVWLPGLVGALDSGVAAEAYIASWFTRCGADGLAARASRLLRRGALTLLCDDYDMLDVSGRERADGALQVLRDASADRLRLIIACDREAFDRDLDGLGALAELPAERLESLRPEVIAREIARSSTGPQQPRKAEAYVKVALSRPLGVALTNPAVARALGETYAAGQPPAWGLSELLRQQLLIKRDFAMAQLNIGAGQDEASGAAREDLPEDLDVALMWGALAASLIAARQAYLPLDTSRLVGESAAVWLAAHPPLIPVSFALLQEQEISYDAGVLEFGLKTGIDAGVLRREPDGLALAFIHPLMRKTAAAYWLDAMDNGLGRMNSDLLTEDWTAPVMLWAGARSDAVDIAQRIYRLSQSPESVAKRAGFARGADVAPAALALALAVAADGAAPWLVSQASATTRDNRRWFASQQELRDQLDATAIMAADSNQRPALARALKQVRSRANPTFEASVFALIALEPLDRLARAQLILLLGLLATPDSLNLLLTLVGQQDITLRQAARQAILYAGAEAIPTLQALASSQTTPVLRERAMEALELVMAATPEAMELAGTAAISGLRSADPGQRRVAVTTLSAMRVAEALDALTARLDDTNLDVRIAATRAIGQLGAVDGLAALRKRAHAEPPAFRRAVAEALGAAPEPQSVATLLTLLRDRDPAVRAASAIALGAHGDQRAAGPLRGAAHDVNPWVSQAAQAAVRRLTGG